MSDIFVGVVGAEIVLDCGTDISSATVMKIRARRATGVVIWDAVVDGTTAVKRVTAEGDIDVSGPWRLQAYVEMPGWKGYGSVATLHVSAPI